MGGAATIIEKAKADFDKGEYRWVAEALKHVVFADANNTAAKELLADAYEQMGYQAESGPWRSIYLQGALELRHGVPTAGSIETAGPDTVRAMPPEMTFDYLAVQLNAEKASGKNLAVTIEFSDLSQAYALTVENGVLNYSKKPNPASTAKVILTKATFDRIQIGEITVEQAITSGDVKIEGQREALGELVAMLDTFDFWFNIVTGVAGRPRWNANGWRLSGCGRALRFRSIRQRLRLRRTSRAWSEGGAPAADRGCNLPSRCHRIRRSRQQRCWLCSGQYGLLAGGTPFECISAAAFFTGRGFACLGSDGGFQPVGVTGAEGFRENHDTKPGRFITVEVSGSQRRPANGKASIRIGPTFAWSSPRTRPRAR